MGPFGFPLPAWSGFFSPDWARSLRVARCQSPILKPSVCRRPPLPFRTSRSFQIIALCPVSAGETYHSELPDLPSLPAALQ
jgi:hypothetical protein